MYANFPKVQLLGTTGTFRKGKNWHLKIVTTKIGTNKRDVRAEMLFSFIKPGVFFIFSLPLPPWLLMLLPSLTSYAVLFYTLDGTEIIIANSKCYTSSSTPPTKSC